MHKIRFVLADIVTATHDNDPLPAMNCAVTTNWPERVVIRVDVERASKTPHLTNVFDGQSVMLTINRAAETARNERWL